MVHPRSGKPARIAPGICCGVLLWAMATAVAAQSFGVPENVAAVNSGASEDAPYLTLDGLSLYFSRGGGSQGRILVATRTSLAEPFGPPSQTHIVNLDMDQRQTLGSLSADQLTLYLSSDPLPGGVGSSDIWVATRPDTGSDFSVPTLLPNVNSTAGDLFPRVSPDDLSLYLISSRSGNSEIWVARRNSTAESFGTPTKAEFTQINSLISGSVFIYGVSISPDERRLYFGLDDPVNQNPQRQLWVATRSSKTAAFGPPTQGAFANIKNGGGAYSPAISPLGNEIFFGGHNDRSGGAGSDDIWRATRDVTPSLPNLIVTSSDFGPAAPVRLQPGDPVVVGAFVENIGGAGAGTFWLEFWGSRTGGLMIDAPLTDSDLLGPLAPGAGYSVAANKLLRSVPDGPYTIVCFADRIDEVAEWDECDNRAIVRGKRILVIRPQTQADLVVENFSFGPNPVYSGAPIQLGGQVRNVGAEDSGEFWIEFWGWRPLWVEQHYPDLHYVLCDSIKIDNLAPGALVDLSAYSRTLNYVPYGNYWVGCYVDRPDYVNELDETNNYIFERGHILNPVTLSATTEQSAIRNPQSEIRRQLDLPDIAITYFDFDPPAPTELQPGDYVTFYLWLENRGTTDTGPFWLEFWASGLGGLNIWPLLADQSERIPNLAAGESRGLALSKPLMGLPDGSWTAVAVADRLHEVLERDETNNRRAASGKRVLVIRSPQDVNLVLENVTITSGPLHQGAPVQVRATVRNTGGANSGEFWIETWLSNDACYPGLDIMVSDSKRINDLPPGGTYDFVAIAESPYGWVPPARYAIGCFADRVDQVNETEESDNYAFRPDR